MPSRPVLVLCEGPHDIAFLTRLLMATVGAVPFKSLVKDLPAPLGQFFLKRFESRNATKSKSGTKGIILRDALPSLASVWESADNSRHWYFINCDGKDHPKEVNEFLRLLLALCKNPDPTLALSSVGIVLVNDADEVGVAATHASLIANFGGVLNAEVPGFATLAPNTSHLNGSFGVATCIFADPATGLGTLEDVIGPLWAQAHAPRFSAARTLMNSLAVAGTKIGPGSTPSRILKATLTTAGQTECPGYSLAVVLRETEALDTDTMKIDPSCNALLKVLTEV